MVIAYIQGKEFRKYLGDWVVAIALILYFFLVAEHARPFERQFLITDLTISHTFATKERVTGIECILISSLGPLAVIMIVSIIRARKLRLSREEFIHNLQIAVLGLFISLSIDGVVTDVLKNWVANLRPDFLARCGPRSGTKTNVLVGLDVCTAPLGQAVLIDGLRSTPSGHSSISFAGLLYLSYWLSGQFKLPQTRQPVWKPLVCGLPLFLATYIALSRTQDYRHHFADIIFGSTLGISFASFSYFRYFNTFASEDMDKPVDQEPIAILPI